MNNRNCGLGASDAGPASGESRWKTRLALWLEKTGQLPPQQESEAMRWGTLLQPAVISEFCRRIGRSPIHGEQRIQHPGIPWMWATVDTRLSDTELVEAKTAGPWSADEFGESGTDEIPTQYVLQCQHQLAVTGARLVHVPVLIAGQELRCFEVQRSDAMIQALVELEADFWRHVEAKTPPPVTPADYGLLDILHRPREADAVDLDEDALDLVRTYERAKDEIKMWEKTSEAAKGALKELMGGAALGLLPDGRRITRSKVERKAFTVAATTYFDFRIREPKKARGK